MKSTQEDSKIEEDHLINFVVNSLDEALTIDLGENLKVMTEILHEVPSGARGDLDQPRLRNDRRLTACQYRPWPFTEHFDLDNVEAVGDALFQLDALEKFPGRPVEIVIDPLLDSYYGDEDETEALYSSQAKRGTTTFQAYATIIWGYARSDTHWGFGS